MSGLSCECGEWDGDGWYWTAPEDFTRYSRKTRRRCRSCVTMIEIGSVCIEIERSRKADEIEARIYGDEENIPIASWYFCERCGEILLNLISYGYCVDIEKSMPELLKEHHQIHGIEVRK